MKKNIFLLLCLSFCFLGFSQEIDNTEEPQPEAYTKDEFPDWAHDLRRAEIITIGSYPLTFFATDLIFSTIRFMVNDFSPNYGISLFMGANSLVPYTEDEKTAIIAISAAASITIAVIDYFLGKAD